MNDAGLIDAALAHGGLILLQAFTLDNLNALDHHVLHRQATGLQLAFTERLGNLLAVVLGHGNAALVLTLDEDAGSIGSRLHRFSKMLAVFIELVIHGGVQRVLQRKATGEALGKVLPGIVSDAQARILAILATLGAGNVGCSLRVVGTRDASPDVGLRPQ